jgi:hypothetical protein
MKLVIYYEILTNVYCPLASFALFMTAVPYNDLFMN